MTLSESQKAELQKLHTSVAFLLVDSSLDRDVKKSLLLFDHDLNRYLYPPKLLEKPAWMS